MSRRMAHKTINRQNARRMIDTSDMLGKEKSEMYQSRSMSVYMEDVMRRLEKLQRNESEEEGRPAKHLTKRKQEIWDNQFLIHHGRLAVDKLSLIHI